MDSCNKNIKFKISNYLFKIYTYINYIILICYIKILNLILLITYLKYTHI